MKMVREHLGDSTQDRELGMLEHANIMWRKNSGDSGYVSGSRLYEERLTGKSETDVNLKVGYASDTQERAF